MALRRLSFNQQVQGFQAYTPCGSMDKQITLMALGPNNPDGSTGDLVAFTTSWANIKALFAQEIKQAGEIVKQVTHLVTMPYQAGLNESMQVQFETRLWQIVGIEDPDERHIELRILCLERDQNA